MAEQPLLKKTRKKGGFKALPFILGNDALEKMATYGVTTNMILYLVNEYHMEMTTASNILFLWTAANNSMPIIGAGIADSYLGRFYTIGLGSIVYLMGMVLLWLTTFIAQARPPPCDQSSDSCSPPMFLQSMVLCSSLGLISVGAGGIRASSMAFGADQLENEDDKENSGVGESYFSWYYTLYMFAILMGLTCVVYVQDNMGWKIGFGFAFVLMMFGTVSFFLASPFYVQVQTNTSLMAGLFQVVMASFRNRHFKLPSDTATNIIYYHKNGPAPGFPSSKLRFLNKACIIRDPQKDLMPDGRARDPWRLCTVDQVEDLKALLRVVPIWSTGMIMFVNLSQTSFPVLQAAATNRRITSGFTIPAASLGTITFLTVIVWVALKDSVLLPLASRVMGRPVHISTTRRMGIGIFLSSLAMSVTAAVESIRRGRAIKEGNNSEHHLISALWLVPQNCLFGLTDGFNDIAQSEFYFSELPKSMSSIASNLSGLGFAVGSLLASFVMNMVDSISKAGGHQSWISTDINKGHYDYYYLVLAGLSLANMVYYVVCRRAYGPLKAERRGVTEKEDEF
ncbi:protein NRT1/ PTR FAMILY 1.2 [Sesamum alatum]|uniref:Protein NRT1/ PTR FAMILY 1.2 n=1 Tax=Sesamum alatum TaxID=300844 RepID=A0AAE1XYI1_9LAMI|nr:protein NRT1/ PTR FAMILY 1.2 [Sesamum alatum]